jgi:predicted alpha/beta superfamily hydrolase
MRASLAAVALLLMAPLARAGEPITIGETVTFDSKVMGESRTLLISTPANYGRGGGSYPVLYMTDGEAQFLHTRGTVDFLARNGLMPDLIVVAVPNTDRTRDLTPTRDTIRRRDGTSEERPNSGGGPRFLEFFEREVIPYVESHYRTRPFRLFAGHSLGGLFALEALVEKPALFQAVIAVSPALAWDDDWVIARLEKFAGEKPPGMRTLVVTMADEEEGDKKPNRLDRLEAILAVGRPAGLTWHIRRMPEEDHGTVVLKSHLEALRLIYDGWRLPVDRATGLVPLGLNELQRHYAALSQRFGYPVPPPEQTVNLAGYSALRNANDSTTALALFLYNIELYPNSPNVYDSYAEALEGAGRLEEAVANYRTAVRLAERPLDPRLEVYRANRDRAEQKLREAPPKAAPGP